MKKLAIITTHPIQYYAPLFKLLSQRQKISIKVFYTWGNSVLENKYDPGFGKIIEWDIPLLDGYDYTFTTNISSDPGSHHFKGIDTPALNNEIELWGADAILIFGWNFKSHLSCIRYFYGKIPILFRGDSTLLDRQPFPKNILRSLFLKWIYKHVNYALYVGTNNKQYYLKCGVKPNQFIFTPHAIDNKRFYDDSTREYYIKAKELRTRFEVKDNDILFLYAGKLEPKKNPELLLNAFKQINKQNIHLLVVGNGILEENIKEKFAAIKNLHFLDFQNQSIMPSIYHACDIFVLPSRGPGETWGLAVNEAMACSKAVLVSNKVGCAIDLVENGVNGYIFVSEKLDDLINKMLLISNSKEETKMMGEKSAQKIKNWNFETTVTSIENFFE